MRYYDFLNTSSFCSKLKKKDILCANPFHLLDLSVFVARQSLYQSTENTPISNLSGIGGKEPEMPDT